MDPAQWVTATRGTRGRRRGQEACGGGARRGGDAGGGARAAALLGGSRHGVRVSEIAQAERSFGEIAQDAAEEAARLGRAAIACARRGDFLGALNCARSAAQIEREYGD